MWKKQLTDVLGKMARATKKNGIIYTSFKYGDFEGVRNGRFFTYLTEESIKEIPKNINGLSVEKMWISSDVRTERGDEK